MRTVDLSPKTWGCDAATRPLTPDGVRISVTGWHRPRPVVGDYLILRAGPEETTRYQVESVRYSGDPPDMFFAEAVFAPRGVVDEETRRG